MTVPDNPKPRRRWLQFRLKTLLLVTAVLCVPLAWIGVRMNEKRRERAVIAEIERLGGRVGYDWQMDAYAGWWLVPEPDAEPIGPHWLRWFVGDDFFSQAVYVHLPADMESYFHKYRGDCPSSSEYTKGPAANDDDLRLVATFAAIEVLDLSYAEIGDAGLANLSKLTKLRYLDLQYTDVTDDGLRHLKALTALQHLNLTGTKTTKAGVDDLAKALPECKIYGP